MIGDLHLSRQGAHDGYRGDAETLIRLIATLAEETEGVVLVGDVYDLDRGTLPFGFAREKRMADALWQPVVDALHDHNVLSVVGNHDRWLLNEGALEAVEISTPTGRWRIEHGDRFNSWIKQWPPFTHLVTWCSGVVTRAGWMGVYTHMRQVEGLFRAGAGSSETIMARCQRFLQAETHLRGMVVGHTHQPGVSALNDQRWLLNAGAGLTGNPQYALVDGRAGVGEVREWRREGERTLALASWPGGSERP